MSTQSIISGYIKVPDEKYMSRNRTALNTFPFDEHHPFPNIFWDASPAQYFMPIIGFAGSFHSIEDDWNSWMWRFSQLLRGLEAIEARVYLQCVLGQYSWTLRPESWFRRRGHFETTYVGQQWGIIESPEGDFSLEDPEGKTGGKLVPRWNEN